VATSSESPVLIVGAGPTGLTAALELSRLGVDVRIVDRAAEPCLNSRALAVQARTLELLRVRGVAAAMLPLGNRARGAALHAGSRKIAEVELDRMPSGFNYIPMLAQSETERLLTEQLGRQGVKVERGVQVIGVRTTAVDAEVVMRSDDGATEMVRART
jgi:2-polyprenyl-6-methoxyphenol hydroxylase-like FAD-dependent oxidoreductase